MFLVSLTQGPKMPQDVLNWWVPFLTIPYHQATGASLPNWFCVLPPSPNLPTKWPPATAISHHTKVNRMKLSQSQVRTTSVETCGCIYRAFTRHHVALKETFLLYHG